MGKNKNKIKPTRTLASSPKPNQDLIHTPVAVSFKHIKAGKSQCLSKCVAEEVKDVMDCLRQLTTMTWYDVLRSGGRPGNKAGLGYTPNMPYTKPIGLSKDIDISEIRSSEKARVFGFHNEIKKEHIYYIVGFDRGHDALRKR